MMERYTVSIRFPETGESLLLLIPFSSTSPVSTFAEEIKRRAAKNSHPLGGRIFSLHLGQEDGPILDFDDMLNETILDSREERIFLTFQSTVPETSSSRTRPGPSTNSPDLGGFQIRVITPALAKSCKDITSIPLLGNGAIIDGYMTLREIKTRIIEFLGLSIDISAHRYGDQQCNCAFARQIHQRGYWEKVDCQGHTSSSSCSYRSQSIQIPMSTTCELCFQPISDHEDEDVDMDGRHSPCRAKIFIRTDTSCGHVLHSRCLDAGHTWSCPQSCLACKSSEEPVLHCAACSDLGGKANSLEVVPSGSRANNITQNIRYKFIVLHGKSNVEWVETDQANRASILSKIRERFGNDVEEKRTIQFIGEIQDQSSNTYLKLPVVALCSPARHTDGDPRSQMTDNSSGGGKTLDLHTSEAPIETVNLDLTIGEIGLKECTVNGILNIYVVERTLSNIPSTKGSGQDAIFGRADFWEHPITQSDRGMAAFLSSLRLFTHSINTKDMSQSSQNAILRLILFFTRFPPALRAIHILMSAKSPRASECAALVQALYQIVKDIVPIELVGSDEGRILEGSRLFFGFILDRAAQLENLDEDTFPYLWSLKTIDLKNFETLEPVETPILTIFGLVDEGYYKAYQEGGILSWCNGEDPLKVVRLDRQTHRVALLCGGLVPEVTIFDSDSLSSLSRFGNTEDEELIAEQAFSSLSHLVTLCERHEFGVIPPASLPSVNAPTLTLDRDGLLAVYVGRTPCAEPGKDIAIFRPINGGEENIDVSIVTQNIAPILKQRSDDGTWVFDSFGGLKKLREGKPDELIMFCVDCSRSMGRSSDFEEIKNEERDEMDDDEVSLPENNNTEDGTYPETTLDEMKEMILKHESFEDMLVIVKGARSRGRQSMATLVLDHLNTLFSRELSHYLERLELIRGWGTITHLRNRSTVYDSQITKLKGFIAGLVRHKAALRDFLVFRAESFRDSALWTWGTGQAIPKWPKKSREATDIQNLLVIPHEYMCPIEREVFEDPAIASDGFTYERASIQRWFQFRRSSPSTGLELNDTTLRRNAALADRVRKWVNGEELLQTPSTRRHSWMVSSHISIQFFSRQGSFNRRVPTSASGATLYRLAFQGMKGRHSQFDLHSNGIIISSSASSGLPSSLKTGSIIHINVHEHLLPMSTASNSQGIAPESEFEDICLIKVYSSRDEVLFSYWTSKSTTDSLASVCFRYWRYLIEKGMTFMSHDMAVCANLEYIGDGGCSGTLSNHWENLSQFLTPEKAKGCLQKEDVYGNLSESTNMDVDSNLESSQKPLVLRAYLCKYPGKSNKKAKKATSLSRMDVSKQIFEAFINRTLAYNYPTHIGLITFNTTATVSQGITNVLEDFRDSVNKMKPGGDTAVWDALALANDQLSEYGQRFPEAKKRIICLSDGEDNKSSKKHHEACWSLVQNKVVVDSYCIGNEDNVELRTVSYLSGGYKFYPKTLEQAMSICEMEPVLNQLERPTIRREPIPFLNSARAGLFWSSKPKATPDIVTREQFPQRKEHPNLGDQFVSLSSLARSYRPSATTSGMRSNSHIRSARLLSEMRNIVANPHPQYDVYVSESNIGFWKIIMQGPPESSYSAGTFLLYLDMEDNYPMFPPKGRFCTPIIHPNINRHGRICHSILDRNWTLDTTNLQVLNTIYSLLLVPEFSDPINTVVTLNFHWDEVAFQEEVRAHIRNHATKSRYTWREELLGE